MPLPIEDVHTRARRVRLLLLDVDGVLTDGGVAIRSTRDEHKTFFIRDGAALVWARHEGLAVGLLSGRPSGATSRRATELGITIVSQGDPDKRQGYAGILASQGFSDEQVAYMGDEVVETKDEVWGLPDAPAIHPASFGELVTLPGLSGGQPDQQGDEHAEEKSVILHVQPR